MSVLSERAAVSGARLTRPEQLCDLLGVPFSEPQLRAATAPLEPGVVVAGAGSGKTTVMAARVVWLVGSGAVEPGEVLGLTFTNKAAAELAGRIRAALTAAGLDGAPAGSSRPAIDAGAGDDAADADDAAALEPTVSTYHAYAGRLVAEHGLRLGVEPQARLLADATRYQLAARVLRRAPGPLRALSKPVSMLVDDLVAFDAELAEHLVDPERVRAFDRALLEELLALPSRTKDVDNVAESARKRLELLDIVEAYRGEKRERDLIDFGDQVSIGAELAESCPEVGAAERGRFRIVLLDEYQDTSVGQRRMLCGLFGGGHSVTAVGDPCQAIYGWRGASVANLDSFPTHFPRADGSPATRYSLVENRRSGSRLLALANAVAAPLREVHGVEPLTACAAREGAGDTVCALLPTYDDEIAWSADQVVDALRDGVPPAEIAVLVRARSDFAAMYAALGAREVPVEVVGLGGLLSLPEVADVVSVLQVLDDATANAALVRLLTGPRWRIGPRDLALLGRRARDLVRAERTSGSARPHGAPDADVSTAIDAALEEAVAGVDPSEIVSLSDALSRPGAGVPYSPEARARFAELDAELDTLRRCVDEPLLDLLHRVVTLTGLDVELAASPASIAARRRDNLGGFLDQAARFSDLDGESSVTAFLAFLRAAEEWERGLDTTAPSGADTVKLLTAHKAKGLEWDVVVLPDLTMKVFPSSRGRARWTSNGHVLPYPLRGDFGDGLSGLSGLPQVPAWTAKGLKQFVAALVEHGELEERRLGYVAFTRARLRLVASAHWWGPTQKRPRGPSPFLEEIRAHCAAGDGVVDHWAPDPSEAANPHLEATRARVDWPVALDATALALRRDVATRVGAAVRNGAGGGALAALPALDEREQALVAGWDHDADALLDELLRARARATEVALPAALTTSQLQRLAADPDGLAHDLVRPLPRRPGVAARRGTRFHAWVETRFGEQPLLPADELPGAGDAHIDSESELRELQEAFLRSDYAERKPYAIEAPFSLVLAGRVVRGRIDAVYATDDGFEVVDWKTNKAETADPLQLAVYRLAWAEISGVPVESVLASFAYVRTGSVVRPADLPGRAELERLVSERPAGP